MRRRVAPAPRRRSASSGSPKSPPAPKPPKQGPPDRRRASPLIVRPNLFCRRSKVARTVSTETQLEAGRHKHPHKCCRRCAASASDVAKCRRPSRTPSAANGVWMSSSSCANPCSRWCRRRADPVSLLSGRAPVAVAPTFRLSLRLRADDHMYRATTSDAAQELDYFYFHRRTRADSCLVSPLSPFFAAI
jgi:hypothetical protein